MKHVLGFLAGTLVGVVLCVVALYYNPLADVRATSPLAISEQALIDLSYSAVPAESIAFTNDGESKTPPHPETIAELWEPAIKRTKVLVTLLSDRPGSTAGIGIKYSSDSERTRLLASEAMVDSAWHVYLPGRGTFFIDQTENVWSYLRNIVIPARWNSAHNWRGAWFGIVTAGPGALGTAWLTGGSGQFADLRAEVIEAWNAKAYSAERGPVAMSGSLTIALPPSAP